jgi:hypothetical protein
MNKAEEFTIKGIECVAFKNEEKGIVAVRPKDSMVFIDTCLNYNEKPVLIDHLVATAKTHPDDKFDYHVGCSLATNRLMKKIDREFKKTIKQQEEELERLKEKTYKFSDFVYKHTCKVDGLLNRKK